MKRRHPGVLVGACTLALCATSATGQAAVLEPKEVDEAKLRAFVEDRGLPFEDFGIKLQKGGSLSGSMMNTWVSGSWEAKGDSLRIVGEKSFSYPDLEGDITQGFETTYSGARLLTDSTIYFARSETALRYKGVKGGDFSKKKLAKLKRDLTGKHKGYDLIFSLGEEGAEHRIGLQLIDGGGDTALHERAASLLVEAAERLDLVVVSGGRAKNKRKSSEVHIHDPKLGKREAEEDGVPWTLQLGLLSLDPATEPKVKLWKKRGYLATVITGSGGAKFDQSSVTTAIEMIEGARAPIDRKIGARAVATLLDQGLDLKQGLGNKEDQVRQLFAAGIALRPDKAGPYRQTLVKGLDTEDLAQLLSTVEILGHMGYSFEQETLVKAARGFKDVELARATTRALVAVGPAAVIPACDGIAALRRAYNHDDSAQRRALWGMAKMGDAAFAPLVAAVEEWGGDSSRKSVAVLWLARTGPRAAPKLCEWLERKDSPVDKVDILKAMVELAHSHDETHAALRTSAQKFSEHKWAPIAKHARFVLNATKPR